MDNVKQFFKELGSFLGEKLDALLKQNKTITARLDEIARKDSPVIQIHTEPGPPGHTPSDAELLNLILPLIPEVKDGHTPTPEELLAIIQPLIPKVEDGHTPTTEELLAVITPLIPQVKNGETPSDAKLRSLIKPLIPKVEDGKNGSPDTGKEIIDKINVDKSEKKIRKEKVEGLEDIEMRVRTAEANSNTFLHFSGSTILAHDLSSYLDGITKTFTLPSNARVLLVITSSFPNILRPTVDYTTTASTITFTTEIDAASTLATGQSIMILYKLP